ALPGSRGPRHGDSPSLANDGSDYTDFTGPNASAPSGPVAKKPPVASICAPVDGTIVLVNQPVVLCGDGYDAEDGTNTADSWTVTGPGRYQTTASGDHIDLQPPGPAHRWAAGEYTATFTVTDSDGNPGAAVTPSVVHSAASL